MRLAYRHLPALALLLLLLLASTSAAQTRTRADDASIPTGATRGAVAGTYALSGFDAVNLSNGKLNFRLPLLDVSGRGTAGYTMALTIDKQWWVEHETVLQNCTPEGCIYSDHYTALDTRNEIVLPGWSAGSMHGVHAGYTYQCGSNPRAYDQAVTRLFFTAQDDTQTEFRDTIYNGGGKLASCDGLDGHSRGREFVSVDGSGMTFISDAPIRDYLQYGRFRATGTLTMRDGTQYRFVDGQVQGSLIVMATV